MQDIMLLVLVSCALRTKSVTQYSDSPKLMHLHGFEQIGSFGQAEAISPYLRGYVEGFWIVEWGMRG